MEASSKNSNYSQPLNAATVLKLPNELLELIFQYLKGCDVISFALTCKRFSSFTQSVTHLNLDNAGSSLGKSLPIVNSFFRSHVNPSLLRSCNLNGCYWIPTSTLKSLLIKCNNLEELHVLETKLTISEMVTDILLKCKQVTKLSFTLKKGDWFPFAAHLGKRKQPALCRLKSVEMMVADSCSSLEMSHFLQSCEKLEEIVVHWINDESIDYDSKLSRNPSMLKSVVFVATPMYAKPTPLFFDVRESSNLTTFWCNLLQLHHSNHLNKLTSVAWAVHGRRNQLLPIEVLHPGLELGHLESYWEPEPILMRSVLNSPTKLKLISCFYDSNNFQNFSENHPLLEVLKLGTEGRTLTYLKEDSWRNLSRLRILSLEAALIQQGYQRLPYLATIVQTCPLIQELEIIGLKLYRTYLNDEQLCSIALLGSTLKRLTLADFSIENGLFLEHILKRCDQLESLRLKSLDWINGTHLCCYSSNLITALPSAKKLKTFCLFQKQVPKIELLLDSLENCTSISRLSLVCPSLSLEESFPKLSKEEFSSRLIRLCDRLSQLVALFGYFNMPYENCEEANKLLRERFEKERPAFRVDVQSMSHDGPHDAYDGELRDSYDTEEFPIMFNDVLTSFQSRVALVPYNCNTFLRRAC